MDYNFDKDIITIKTAPLVKLYEHFTLITDDGAIDLKVEIQADFEGIPEKYFEVFVNMLSAKYAKTVSFGANPFSECQAPEKVRWYQFWRRRWLSR